MMGFLKSLLSEQFNEGYIEGPGYDKKVSALDTMEKYAFKSSYKKIDEEAYRTINSPQKVANILGVKPDASQQNIKQAYWKLVKKYHPDLAESEEMRTVYDQKFREIKNAYDTLMIKNKIIQVKTSNS